MHGARSPGCGHFCPRFGALGRPKRRCTLYSYVVVIYIDLVCFNIIIQKGNTHSFFTFSENSPFNNLKTLVHFSVVPSALHGRMAGFTVSAILKFTPLSGAHNEEPLCYLLEVTCALSWLHSFHFCISLSQPHSLSLHLYAVMYMSTPNTFSHRLTCRVCLCSLTCSRAAASFKI